MWEMFFCTYCSYMYTHPDTEHMTAQDLPVMTYLPVICNAAVIHQDSLPNVQQHSLYICTQSRLHGHFYVLVCNN